MTLFRKVFQNQSRPASEDEALDEDALRAAFMEMDSQNDLLILEPFERVAPDEASANASQQDDRKADTQAVKAAEMEDGALSEAMKAEACGSQDADTEVLSLEDDAQAAKATDVGAAVQSDEEIAAFLDRALAIDPVAGSEEETKTTDDDNGEPAGKADDAITAEEAKPVHMSDHENDDTEKPVSLATQEKAFSIDQLGAAAEVDLSSPRGDVTHAKADHSAEIALNTVPAPAAGRAGRRVGRVKTRLLGFNRGEETADPFGRASEATATAQREKFPVGWLVIVEGPGVGHAFSIFTGASMIGRGEDQVIRLDFGDNSISRHNHAAIAYDEEDNKFYIGHGGKSNIIRRNARPVLTTEELHHADLIRIGETTLRFVALCGSDFRWSGVERPDAAGA